MAGTKGFARQPIPHICEVLSASRHGLDRNRQSEGEGARASHPYWKLGNEKHLDIPGVAEHPGPRIGEIYTPSQQRQIQRGQLTGNCTVVNHCRLLLELKRSYLYDVRRIPARVRYQCRLGTVPKLDMPDIVEHPGSGVGGIYIPYQQRQIQGGQVTGSCSMVNHG